MTLCAVLCLVTQSCLTVFDSVDCSLSGFSVHGDSPGKNTGVDCHALLQGTFPTQGSNPSLPHCWQILYHLSHKGSPRILEWVDLPLLQGIFLTQGSNWGLLHCRWIIYQLRYQGSHNGIYHVAIYCSHQNYFQKSECSRDRKHTLGEQCNSPIKKIINSYEVIMYTVCNQIPLYD